ncbi:MAG TPA: hypothetical protein VK955_17420, partial [Xanthobacteraceae bacterium]|nr:hypothetical protein [Xanthobacteraceae bacterium]
EHPASQVATTQMRSRHAKVAGGGGGKTVAGAADPRRSDTCARGCNGMADETTAAERTSAAAQSADARSAEGTSSNPQTSAAAGKTNTAAASPCKTDPPTTSREAYSTAMAAGPSNVAAKATATSSTPATTAATTGVGCNGDQGNEEEQHRGNADAGFQRRPRIFESGRVRSLRRLNHRRMRASSRAESF